MPRSVKHSKSYIVVFCEGESEQAYTEFLKKEFRDVAVFKSPKGLFGEAEDKFNKDKSYKENAEVTDEIWFFFDVEISDSVFWDKRLKIIKKLRSLRKKPGIKVRLLMTSGCIEYWLMLHYEKYTPSVQTAAEKNRVIERLLTREPLYKKGNAEITAKIAQNYPIAVVNAEYTVSRLIGDGLPGIADTDERNCWLCKNCPTFSTVYEAINFLASLT